LIDLKEFTRPAGKTIQLSRVDPDSTGEFKNKTATTKLITEMNRELIRYQDMQMAHEEHGLLMLFQGMDTAGKDEVIRDALSSLDPRGCEFKQFKKQTEKEARHDFLWRAVQGLPARGQIGIFNRSYYEHVLGERVHPERLEDQNLPEAAKKDVWEKRLRQINDFERYLTENGIVLLKFFLVVSKEEQRRRLLERIEDPEMQWRFTESDMQTRALWDEYHAVFEETLTKTNTAHAPWLIVPANHRWYVHVVAASAILQALKSFHDGYPEVDDEQKKFLEDSRTKLESEAEE
jgi:PPK2 family polyphosphate:nucleotide phosphotransferase